MRQFAEWKSGVARKPKDPRIQSGRMDRLVLLLLQEAVVPARIVCQQNADDALVTGHARIDSVHERTLITHTQNAIQWWAHNFHAPTEQSEPTVVTLLLNSMQNRKRQVGRSNLPRRRWRVERNESIVFFHVAGWNIQPNAN